MLSWSARGVEGGLFEHVLVETLEVAEGGGGVPLVDVVGGDDLAVPVFVVRVVFGVTIDGEYAIIFGF